MGAHLFFSSAARRAPTVPTADLYAHWKADAGLTLDGSGRVTQWVDQVSGLIASQADAARRPLLAAGSLGGKPSLQFNGGQGLRVPALDLSPTKAVTVAAVARFDGAAPATIFHHDPGQPELVLYQDVNETGVLVLRGVYHRGPYTYPQLPVTTGQPLVSSYRVDTTDPAVLGRLRLNETRAVRLITDPADNLYFLNQQAYIGQLDGGVYYMQGLIAELLVYRVALSDATNDQLCQALGAAYSIAV